jgi:hypothetical protein
LKLSIGVRHANLLPGITAGKTTLRGIHLIYLVMELAEETLGDRLSRKPMSPDEATMLTQQIAAARSPAPPRSPHRSSRPQAGQYSMVGRRLESFRLRRGPGGWRRQRQPHPPGDRFSAVHASGKF